MKRQLIVLGFIMGMALPQLHAQEAPTSKFYLVNQMLGQGIWWIGAEGAILNRPHIYIGASTLIGLQANGDSEYGIYATYGLQPALVTLFGIRPLYVELSPAGNINRREGHTFGSVNMTFGLRYMVQEGYAGLFYMPIVHKTFTAASDYDGLAFGFKFGIWMGQ